MKNGHLLSMKESIDDAKKSIEEAISSHDALTPILCEFSSHIDPLTWLRNQEDCARFFWSNRETAECFAGIGVSDAVSGEQTLSRVKKRSKQGHRRYIGGFFFDGRKGQMWAPLWWTNGKYLVYNPPFPNKEKLIDSMPRLFKSQPNQSDWNQMMSIALDHLNENRIEKIVLASQQKIKVDRDPLECLEMLMRDETKGYSFAFQPGGESIFIGRTPERLFFLMTQR